MLKQRITTALVLVVIFLACLFVLPPVSFNIFALLAFVIASWEWGRLCGFNGKIQKAAYVTLSLAVMSALIWYAVAPGWEVIESRFRQILIPACIWWAIALLWVQTYPQSAVLWKSAWARALIGIAVLAPAWLGFVYLKSLVQGGWWIITVVAIVAVADVGAFLVGKKWGKHKLALNVSPGKTWEGFFGGLGLNMVFALVLWLYLQQSLKAFLILMLIMMATSLASALGDLLESMLKRHQGVKDSGTILPGHGGVLDRIDGLTAAVPVFTLLIIITGWRF